MKLRVKLTIFSISLIIAAVIACCFIILSFTSQNVINQVIDTGLSDYKDFYNSFRELVIQETLDLQIVRHSFLINRFRSITGSQEFTLRLDNEILCNNVGIDAESVIVNIGAANIGNNDTESVRFKTISVNGRDYLVAGGYTMTIGNEVYSIALVRNISDTISNIRILAVKCIVASLLVIIISVAIMWYVIFRSLKPIKKLQKGASELAQGHYKKRIHMDGKDEISALSADFNSMADAIEAHIETLHETANRQQTFINGLSHELKTPVTSIMLNSETLLSRRLSESDMRRSLERIYDQSKWLERLSGKLMTLVMLQGGICIKPERVLELLEAVRETVFVVLVEKNLTLTIDCRMKMLPMDFDLMRSALVNLVNNAAKASDSGQTIELCAYDNVIEVTDHGKGIPQEEITRITEPFYMVDRSRSKKNGGSGLGLALVKRIAEAHDAQLVIESGYLKGTTARIIFKERQ